MPTMSASPSTPPVVAVERITGGLYSIEAGEPFVLPEEEPLRFFVSSSRIRRSEGHTLFFPLHCQVPLVKGQAVAAALRNDTGRKVWLAAGILGTLDDEHGVSRGVSLGLGVIEELAPGETGRISGEITIDCTSYLPLRLVVTWAVLS